MRQIFSALLLASAGYAASLEIVAGGGTGEPGSPVREIALKEPFGVAFDNKGNWYIAEYKGHRVLRVDKKGITSVLAGTGTAGFGGDGGPATAAQLHEPHSVLFARPATLFIPDVRNHAIRAVDLKSGSIRTVAGTGATGFSGDGGPGFKAAFNQAYAAALTPKGDKLYICDLGNRRIRVLDVKSGVVTAFAGNGESGVPQDGAEALSSPLVDPRAVAVGLKGEVYILERRGNALRVVENGKIRTLIGPDALTPKLNGPKDLCVAPDGAVIVVDTENHIVRRYSPRDGTTTTIVGSGKRGGKFVAGDPLATELNRPHGVAYGPDRALYISDSENNRVLKLK